MFRFNKKFISKFKKTAVFFAAGFSFFILFSFPNAIASAQDFNPNNLLSDKEMLDYQSMSLKEIEDFLKERDSVLKNYACHLTEREITQVQEGEQVCNDYLTGYVCLIGYENCPNQENDSVQVEKLQTFLSGYYNDKTIKTTGIFDQTTFDAVIKFQKEYWKEILFEPYGLTKDQATGYVGPTTVKQINKLYCEKLNKFSYPGASTIQNGTEKVWQCYFLSDPPEKKEGDGEEMSAAEVIYNLSQKYKISPKVVLVTLQKEQSLIDNSSPPQGLDHALDWAMGYGCYEGGSWSEKLRGFYAQIDGALWQFRQWFDFQENYPYLFQKGGTYVLIDRTAGETTVTPANRATAFLYRYTPHVYNGNYNFWRFWREYFGDFENASSDSQDKTVKYPDGTLLRVKNSFDVWLIEAGEKRKFTVSAEEFTALDFKWDDIKEISEKDLEIYGTGQPIKYGPDGSLLKEPGSKVYFIEAGRKRWIPSLTLFNKLGYQWSDVKESSEKELESILSGTPMLYPDGSLIKGSAPQVFLIEQGKRRQITSAALFRKLGYRWEDILEISNQELTFYSIGSPLLYPDGTLIREKNRSTVWLVEGGKRREFTDGALFQKLGYRWSDVIEVSEAEVKNHSLGKPILWPNGTLIREKNHSTVFLIENNQKRKFFSEKLFERLKYRWADIVEVTSGVIKEYPEARPMFWPEGTLLKTSNSDKVYLMKEGKVYWIKTPEEFNQGGYRVEDIVIISEEEIDAMGG